MTEALGQVAANAVPALPFLLTGQMTDLRPDPLATPAPSRCGPTPTCRSTSPATPATAASAGPGTPTTWSASRDRIQARLEAVAPGFGSRVTSRRVLGPRELEARDANLVGGALNGGSSQLHQQLVFRPVPGLGRAETQVKGLYLGSASAHPGGGVHGAPGMNAARAAVAHARFRRRGPR